MNLSVKLFGKEPALVAALLQAVVSVFVTFKLGVSPEQGAFVSAGVAALVGAYTAYAVKQNLLPAIVAAFQALVAIAVAYGLHLDAAETGVLTALLVAGLGLYLRTQADPKAGSPDAPVEVNPTPAVEPLDANVYTSDEDGLLGSH